MQTEAWETDRGWWQGWFLQDSPRSFLAFSARGALCLASDAAALFGRLPPLQISKASGKACVKEQPADGGVASFL
eukprot:scaffold1516_cov230-Pinguiococcus_pyrenoidosus.AAC.2